MEPGEAGEAPRSVAFAKMGRSRNQDADRNLGAAVQLDVVPLSNQTDENRAAAHDAKKNQRISAGRYFAWRHTAMQSAR